MLLTYVAKTGKDKDKLVYITVSKVKSKIRGSRTMVRLGDLNMGLGYNPVTSRYEDCQVYGGWFRGKPDHSHKDHEPMEDWDAFHCGEMIPLVPIIKASANQHKIVSRTTYYRAHLYHPIAHAIKGGCKITFLSINTKDTSINGCMFRLASINGKKESDWIHFSSNIEPEDVKTWMLDFKKNEIQRWKLK